MTNTEADESRASRRFAPDTDPIDPSNAEGVDWPVHYTHDCAGACGMCSAWEEAAALIWGGRASWPAADAVAESKRGAA